MNSFEYGCILAMQGKDCVAIAEDRRCGRRSSPTGMTTSNIFNVAPRLYVALSGRRSHVLAVNDRLKLRKGVYEIEDECDISPRVVSQLLSHLLYERRLRPFKVESVIAGFDPETLEPFICFMDLLGYVQVATDFAINGCAYKKMIGICETLWTPNQNATELLKTISQAMTTFCTPNIIQEWCSSIFMVEKDKTTELLIKKK